MRRLQRGVGLLLGLLLLGGLFQAAFADELTPTPTIQTEPGPITEDPSEPPASADPTPEATPAPTIEPSAPPVVEPSSTPDNTDAPAETPALTPTVDPDHTPGTTATPQPTATPGSLTPSPTSALPTSTALPSATPTHAPTPSPTPEESPEATPTPSPTPTPLPEGKVTFTLPELAFKRNAANPSLLSGAAAVDEAGNKLSVEVSDTGGFDVKKSGTYTVTFSAVHPVRKDVWHDKRTVLVLGERDYNDYVRAHNPIKGDSGSRYRKYLQYRDEIYAQLSVRMQTLTQTLQKRIDLLTSLFPEAARVRYAYPAPVLLDDSGEEESPLSDGVLSYTTDALVETDAPAVRNWADILAVFVAESSLETKDPLDLYNLRKIAFDDLERVFFDMTALSYHMDEETGELWVVLKGLPYTDMIAAYAMEEGRQDQLEELMQPEFQLVFASLSGDASFAENVALSESEKKLLAALPADLSAVREQVVTTACSLVGKVSYFWGGKTMTIGWNELWGVPRSVTAQGSKTTGKVRPYGLDCSGFVLWSFINAMENADLAEVIGAGTATQWGRSTTLGWDEAQPGDLAFLTRPSSDAINHVGIVAAKEADGTYKIVHCSSKENGVVVSEAWSSGFRYMRRPLLYGEGDAS